MIVSVSPAPKTPSASFGSSATNETTVGVPCGPTDPVTSRLSFPSGKVGGTIAEFSKMSQNRP